MCGRVRQIPPAARHRRKNGWKSSVLANSFSTITAAGCFHMACFCSLYFHRPFTVRFHRHDAPRGLKRAPFANDRSQLRVYIADRVWRHAPFAGAVDGLFAFLLLATQNACDRSNLCLIDSGRITPSVRLFQTSQLSTRNHTDAHLTLHLSCFVVS